MNRVILSAAVMALVAGAQANIVFSDGFESGDFSNWTGDGNTEPEVPTIVTDPVYAGTYAAAVGGTNTGGTASAIGRKYKTFAPIATTETFTFSFYLKLGATAAGNRQWAEIRSYTNNTFGGTLDQLIAVGAYNGATNVLNADTTVGALSNTSKWQVRLTGSGYAANAGWFVLDQAANRTTDWTQFDVVVAPTGVEFFVNGTKGHNSTFARGTSTNNWTADTVVLGSGLTSAGNSGFYDSVSVTTSVVPEPASMVALGIGVLAMVRRRRSAK